jgi:hypothetical protein
MTHSSPSEPVKARTKCSDGRGLFAASNDLSMASMMIKANAAPPA